MSVIYEVNLEIEPQLEQDFRGWLPAHIEEVIQTGCFTSAKRYVIETKPGEPILWTTHYFAPDRESIDRYLRDFAPALRKHALDRFGERFKATRRILSPL
jgi:hypothetical protein